MPRYKRKLSKMDHSTHLHSTGEAQPEPGQGRPEPSHPKLHFHDVHDIALDLVFKHVSLPSACVLRRVCKRWNDHLDAPFQLCTLALLNKDLLREDLREYIKERRNFVRNILYYGKYVFGQEDANTRLYQFCCMFQNVSDMQRIVLSEHNISSSMLRKLTEKTFPKQCRLFLTKLLVSDVDRYLIPESWYSLTIERRSGSTRIGNLLVEIDMNVNVEGKTEQEKEVMFGRQVQRMAHACATPMDEYEICALKTRLNRMVFVHNVPGSSGAWLEQVLKDILKQHEGPEFLFVNVVQLELGGLRPLTVRLVERLLMEIMSSGVLNNNL
ncbi:hypothetical protein RvY_11199 [Ramazzottius varieornatus]|uniref:F-box domain-containing protein n=1 Tax=Ramazzottius varieornatus TaxID=947166 RepID=A0A1D1VFE1_RAMVA|nr:hypothetical protein RvY_11199 [Ramazzottius varieornatus]